MKKGWSRELLKIAAVLFSLSLLIGFVWYEQNRVGLGADDDGRLILDEGLVEEVSFSPDENWSKLEVSDVLMPSSKSAALPVFRRDDSRLDFSGSGAEKESEEDAPRTLMHSSKLSVLVFAQITDPGEGTKETSDSTLEIRNAKGGNGDGSTFEANAPGIKPENVGRKPLMGSSKSGPVFVPLEVIPGKEEKEKPAPEKQPKAIMRSTKSFPLFK